MQTENIGYWWLGDEIRTPGGRKVKAKIWWGVCKKTRKVALVGTTNLHPIMITSTHISNNECFDGTSCLNMECPYSTSKTLMSAINKSSFKDINTDENLINFFERAFKNIEEWFDGMDDEELINHFKKGYESTTISEQAFERRLPK